MLAEYMDTIFYLLGKGVVILALIILAVSIFGAVLIL